MKTSIRMLGSTILLLVLFFVLSGCASSSNSQSDSSSKETKEKIVYPEKDIEFIVPTAPGGGYDAFARAVTPQLAKHLPSQVNIVVKNIEGAGNVMGFTALYRAKPDGYTLGILGLPGMVVEQLLGRAQYDVNQYTWFGAFGSEPYVLAVNKDRSFRTIQDLQNSSSKIKMSTVGLSTTAGLGSAIAGEVLGTNWDLIPHKGSADSVLAAARGDADVVQQIYSTMKGFIETGDLIPIVVYDINRLPELPDVPTIIEAGYPELADVVKMNWVLAGPPGIPEPIVEIITEAFAKAMKENELQAWAKESKRPLKYNTREAVSDLAKNSLEMFSEYTHILQKYASN